jgi:hypothetical protein
VGAVRLRPVVEDDLAMFQRFATEPGLVGLDWSGFRDAGAPVRRFAVDGFLGADDGRLMVEDEEERAAAGFVSWRAGSYGGLARHWEIGIALLPEWRGRGIGWQAQAMLCDYLFAHSGRRPGRGRARRAGEVGRAARHRRSGRRAGIGARVHRGPLPPAGGDRGQPRLLAVLGGRGPGHDPQRSPR